MSFLRQTISIISSFLLLAYHLFQWGRFTRLGHRVPLLAITVPSRPRPWHFIWKKDNDYVGVLHFKANYIGEVRRRRGGGEEVENRERAFSGLFSWHLSNNSKSKAHYIDFACKVKVQWLILREVDTSGSFQLIIYIRGFRIREPI